MIEALIERMQQLLGPLQTAGDPRQYFHATYLRTTIAAAEEIQRGGFHDPGWVERWDVAFAGFYLDALEADTAGVRPARPWEIAFSAPREMPALRHVLLGMNAHINFDLPQALVAVITDDEFENAVLLDRRSADHRTIDRVLVSRVAAEDDELVSISGRSLLDRLLQPLNRLGTHRFLRPAIDHHYDDVSACSGELPIPSCLTEDRAGLGSWLRDPACARATASSTVPCYRAGQGQDS